MAQHLFLNFYYAQTHTKYLPQIWHSFVLVS